jgi:hypothetical protein
MNEHHLEAGLRALHVARAQLPDPPALHERMLALSFDDIPQRRSWLSRLNMGGLRSLFSATEVALASAVVALFGFVVLAGVMLTGRPETPAIGATPTATSLASPMPTSDDGPVTTERSDLVPGVDLTVEEVAPGVLRVIGDGEHDLTRDTWDVAVSASGDVFTTSYRVTSYRTSGAPSGLEDFEVIHLGESDPYVPAKPHKDSDLVRIADGSVRLELWADRAEVFRDGRWFEAEFRARPDAATLAPSINWVGTWYEEGDFPGYVGSDEPRYARDDLGLAPGEYVLDCIGMDNGGDWCVVVRLSDPQLRWLREGADAALELPAGDTTPFAGLVRFDGSSSSRVPPSDDGGLVAMPTGYDAPTGSGSVPFLVDWRGNVWLTGLDAAGSAVLARWDGTRWSIHRDDGPHAWTAFDALWPEPDGAIWIGESTVFDGSSFQHIPIPAQAGNGEPHILALDHARDGNTWMVVTDGRQGSASGCEKKDPCAPTADGLYVITPDAWAAK